MSVPFLLTKCILRDALLPLHAVTLVFRTVCTRRTTAHGTTLVSRSRTQPAAFIFVIYPIRNETTRWNLPPTTPALRVLRGQTWTRRKTIQSACYTKPLLVWARRPGVQEFIAGSRRYDLSEHGFVVYGTCDGCTYSHKA